MKSYFFVPGNRLHKINDIKKLNVYIVIDLEDAVKVSEIEDILDTLLSEPSTYLDYFIRVPLYKKESVIDLGFLKKLMTAGYKKFVFPKIQSTTDLEYIISNINKVELELILLIESARFFIELQRAIVNYSALIKAIALGSHDFMNEIGGEHNLRNLEYPRLQILYLARMINAEAIDIASMELKSESKLKTEILDGFEKGYDAKFYIHPWQIVTKESIEFYSEQDLYWALKVITALDKVDYEAEFNPVVIDGQIIERAHLNRAKNITQYYESK